MPRPTCLDSASALGLAAADLQGYNSELHKELATLHIPQDELDSLLKEAQAKEAEEARAAAAEQGAHARTHACMLARGGAVHTTCRRM